MPTYRFGPFTIDTDTRLLLRAGEIVQLTPKAFDLLLLLVERGGRVVAKDELLRAVWPESEFVEEWNLTQHVYALRHALGEQKAGPHFIETVPRRGYRLGVKVTETRGGEDAAARPDAAVQVSFSQLTFRRGAIHRARFTPDGRAVVYGAAFGGAAQELYLMGTNEGEHEERALGLVGAGLLAVSGQGEFAISVRERPLRGYIRAGTLARMSLTSGARPRELLDGVQEAEWAPDGAGLAVVRDSMGRNRLEYPVGHMLYETGGWISHLRFSPAGDLIAFIDHPLQNDDRGSIAVIRPGKRAEVISVGWLSAQGLAWAPKGNEIWFTATKRGNARTLCAVTLEGRERLVQKAPGALTLQDISSTGEVLLTRQNTRVSIIGLAPGEARERDLSWLDWSLARDLSADGRTLLFTEAGEGGGATYGVYLRGTDGTSAVRLGDGSALALSPDGCWALARVAAPAPQMVLLPTGAGAPRSLERAPLGYQQWACWFPDSEHILFTANAPERGTQLFVQDIKGGAPSCLTPGEEGIHLSSPHSISPDGELIAAVGPDNKFRLYDVKGGVREVPDVAEEDVPVRWSTDGRSLYIYKRGELPARVCLLEVATGRRTPWREIMPPDPVGVVEVLRVLLTPDGTSYAYTYTRDLSELFVVRGLCC